MKTGSPIHCMLLSSLLVAACAGESQSDSAAESTDSPIRVRVVNDSGRAVRVRIGPTDYGQLAPGAMSDYERVPLCDNPVELDGQSLEPVSFCCAASGFEELCAGQWTYTVTPHGTWRAADLGGGAGGSAPDPVEASSCEQPALAGDNCWKQAVREASACLDASSEGTMNADRTSCSYPDGSRVDFATAVPIDVDTEYAWDASVTSAAGECARLREEGPSGLFGMSLQTRLGQVDVTPLPTFDGVRVSCPDGTGFEAALDAGCLGELPGITFAGSHLSLLPVLDGVEPANLFSCR